VERKFADGALRARRGVARHAKSDVVLIQETKQNDTKFPTKELADLGYESAHYGQGQWNGVAILSKLGIEDVARGFGDDDPEARIIAATCGDVRVVSCYVPNGRALDNPHYVYKLQWLEKLRDLVAARDAISPLSSVAIQRDADRFRLLRPVAVHRRDARERAGARGVTRLGSDGTD